MKRVIALLIFFMFLGLNMVLAEDVLPKYSIFTDKVTDRPGKTQVKLEIIVSGKITEQGLRSLLNNLYHSTANRKGFKFHKHPTLIAIYAYTSKERVQSGMGQWIAMLLKQLNNNPDISINKNQIVQLNKKPEKKLGLSETKRKQIWFELVKAEDRADKKIRRTYPMPDYLEPNYAQKASRQTEKQMELRKMLYKKLKRELAKKHNLTVKNLSEISGEGLEKEWPFP